MYVGFLVPEYFVPGTSPLPCLGAPPITDLIRSALTVGLGIFVWGMKWQFKIGPQESLKLSKFAIRTTQITCLIRVFDIGVWLSSFRYQLRLCGYSKYS